MTCSTGWALFQGIAPKAGPVIENSKALFASARAAAVGAILGISTVTICGTQSATGIAAGGCMGLTACSTGPLFLLALVFSPAFLVIPRIATTPVLIMEGIFITEPISTLDLSDFTVVMPFTYNIAYAFCFPCSAILSAK